MTKEELLAEEHICNGKCKDDITRNYVHCKTCTRLKDFLTGYKAGKAELEEKLANADYQLEGRDLEIKELKAQLEQEKNLNQCLSDHNEQLRELIEEMKCCFNCKHSRTEYEHCKTDKHEKWEIKEK